MVQRVARSSFVGMLLVGALALAGVATPATASVSAPLGVRPGAAVKTIANPASDRIWGADRFATSVAVSKLAFPGTVDTVYLASGLNYPDALGAGPAAVADGAGLLLTQPTVLPAVVERELRRLAPTRIVLVGGSGAIGGKVAETARRIAPEVVRVSGADRYETARALVRTAFPAGASRVLIATGSDFPDALSAGPAAAALGAPLLVVRGSARTLDRPTLALLDELGAARATIVGGTGVVSSGIESQLVSLLGRGAVDRSQGKDRYATSLAINAAAFAGIAAGDAYTATGTGYADAIAVTALAGARKRPLYLSIPYCVRADLASVLHGPTVTRVRVVGGPAALRSTVGLVRPCQSLSDPASTWVVVNKQRPLAPTSYTPRDLVAPRVANPSGERLDRRAAEALQRMSAASVAAGAGAIGLTSGYRSRGTQAALWDADVRAGGVAYADAWTARPGYSEHQTGFAADVYAVSSWCTGIGCFGDTSQGRWAAANAWRYGFIVRYESGRTPITGYSPEPWHLRYVGTEVAQNYRSGGWHTLEQYFELPAAPRY